MCAFAAFAGMLFGYDSGYISSVLGMKEFKLDYGHQVDRIDQNAVLRPGTTDTYIDYDTWQKSLIVSILSAGTFFGALTAAPGCDFFGRRIGLLISVIVFTFGVILQTAATAIPMFVAGRFFAGYGVGMISASIPLYQSETSPKWIRGTVGKSPS